MKARLKTAQRPVFVLSLVALVLAAILLFAHYHYGFYRQTLNIGEAVSIKVKPGMSFSQFINELQARGMVDYPAYWLLYARVHSLDKKLPSGQHEIPAMTTNSVKFLEKVINGDYLPTRRFTIFEGWNLRQTLKAMQDNPFINLSSEAAASLLKQRENIEHYKEGWLFPDTYLFKGIIDGDLLLRQAQNAMANKLNALWEKRSAGLPYRSAYEVLVLASIIEKEAMLDSERPQIAGVFIERLRRGMLLQADPTVIYGIDNFNGDLSKADLKADTLYNTYTRKGLPPTPIAMPGEASLQAALHPADEEYLYFVSKKDGSHHFSRTYEEHKAAVNRYQLGLPKRAK